MVRYVRRVVGAIALDPASYEDVEADPGATSHAATTVVLASLAAGIGWRRFGDPSMSIFTFMAITLVMWAAWSLLTFEVGARLLPGRRTHADVGELLRTLGFAVSPGLLLVFGALPGLTLPVFAMVALWMLVAMIVAVRQALDYSSTGRAIAVCLVGWLLTIVLALVSGFFLGARVA
jgi:hypothetical protein